MRMIGTKYGLSASGTIGIVVKMSASATTPMTAATASGIFRFGDRR